MHLLAVLGFLGVLILLLFYLLVAFLFSLSYLVWMIWKAWRDSSPWLVRYRGILLFGTVTTLILATYIDGAYRYWDAPFKWITWGKYALAMLSGWSALFCYLLGSRVNEPGVPKRVVMWTLLVLVGLGVIVHWHAKGGQTWYFLHKAVAERPTDPNAWLDLAWQYKEEGERLEAEVGDEEHTPPDPTPSFQQALQCFNKSVEYGAYGFEVFSARAQVADRIGRSEDALAFAKQALRIAPAVNSDKLAGLSIEILNDIVNCNSGMEPNESESEALKEQSVRWARIKCLPSLINWVFYIFLERG
jgi:tetratricopeptide (TPR) repeat protein